MKKVKVELCHEICLQNNVVCFCCAAAPLFEFVLAKHDTMHVKKLYHMTGVMLGNKIAVLYCNKRMNDGKEVQAYMVMQRYDFRKLSVIYIERMFICYIFYWPKRNSDATCYESLTNPLFEK